jgi:hypothetical protein
VLSFETVTPSTGFQNWVQTVIEQLRSNAQDDPEWGKIVEDCTSVGPHEKSLHLAVFTEPYLTFLMDGKKTVESRFSQNGCAPYDQVAPGDVVLLKRSGDEIVGLAHVSIVQHLTRSEDWEELRSRYQQQLCATDDSFWAEVKDADYASLMWFDRIRELPPIDCDKRDRRGWVVLNHATEQLSLFS